MQVIMRLSQMQKLRQPLYFDKCDSPTFLHYAGLGAARFNQAFADSKTATDIAMTSDRERMKTAVSIAFLDIRTRA